MSAPRPLRVVVMGVSGCGKSTIGRALAQRLNLPYLEGDELHPPANVARMAAGVPLTDDDRQGWLQAIAQELREAGEGGPAGRPGLVVACSALKRRYRDLLREGAPDLRLVFLTGSPVLLAQRLAGRQGHYMPASLLPSQLQTLEPPDAGEGAIVCDIGHPVPALVEQACRELLETYS